MAIRRAVLAAAAVVGLVPTGPAAHAAGPTITFNFTPTFTHMVGGGYVVGAGCQAIGTPAEPTQTPLAVQITCTLYGANQAVTKTATNPGAHAGVALVMTDPPNFSVCATARAVFLENATAASGLIDVVAGPICKIIPT